MSPECPRVRFTFAAKIYLAMVLTVLLVAAILLGVFVAAHTRALEAALQRKGDALAGSLGESVRVGLLLEDPEFIRQATSGLMRTPELRLAGFFNAGGAPLLWLGDAATPPPESPGPFTDAIRAGGTPFLLPNPSGPGAMSVFVSPVWSEGDGSLAGHVALGISRASIDMERRQVLVTTLAVSAALLGIVCLVGYFLVRNLTRPLKALAHGARRIGEGDLDVVVPREAPDDLGRLADDFNAMVHSLRNAAETVLLQTAALAASERKYRTLFEQIDLPLYILDRNGRFLDCNEALVRLAGLDNRAQVINDGMTCPLLTDGGLPNALMTELLESRGGIQGREVRWVRPDGKEVHALLTARARRDERGEPIAIDGMLTNITALKALQAQLLQARKLESVGTLAGGIAHDFNNLLATMMACAERLAAITAPDDPNRRWLDHILASGQRGAELVRNLLQFARQDGARREPVDPSRLAGDLANLLRETLDPRILVSLHVDAGTGTVHADAGQLHRALLNLCMNARDAMEAAGGEHLDIVVTNVWATRAMCAENPEARPGRYVRITVADDGAGIPPKVRERVFDPFFTTKPQGKGTGLGLATAYGIVREHDGFMTIDSEVGVGTRVHVFLPVTATTMGGPARGPGAAPEPIIPVWQPVATVTRRRWILVVEDEQPLREALTGLLEAGGHRTMAAANGQEALALLAEHGDHVGVAVIDAMMPEMGGDEVVRQIKARHPGLALVVVSGYTREMLEARLGPLECDHFVRKPFSFEQISELVNRTLAQPD